jgi:putative aldouronate transport system permease protein
MSLKKNKLVNNIPYALLVFGLAILGLIFFYPFYSIYIYAFNDGLDSLKSPLVLFPRKFTFDNLVIAFQMKGVAQAFFISISRTVLGTVASMLCTSLLAFAMTKRNIIGYKFFSLYFFIPFMFGGGAISYFLTLKEIHLLDSFLVFIIPGLYSYWNMIVFRSFFDGIPASIHESAELDGASHMKIFFRLLIPMSKPVFAALSLFTAVGHWSDWYSGMFYIKNTKLLPLQTLLQKLLMNLDLASKINQMGSEGSAFASGVTPSAVRLAVVVIVVTPIILIYPLLQKHFVKGVMIGAVKG